MARFPVALRRLILVSLVTIAAGSRAGEEGRIEGRVTTPEGRGLPGVTVVVHGTDLARITREDGSFRFEGLAPGSYTLNFSLREANHSERVEVIVDQTVTVESEVDWEPAFTDAIEVYSASRRLQRITEAPAAVTVVTQQQILREAAHGQVPKLLEFTPGAETTQNGLYDFNFNSRGFNSSLNRRVLTLVDGRDVSVIFVGMQEWPTSLSGSPGLLASIELVRGPGSALYGANAYNGVLNLVTRAPRDNLGGQLRWTAGELDTARLDLTWAGSLGADWYARLHGGYLESDDFARSRVDLNGDGLPDVGTEVEYEGLPLERSPLLRDRNEIAWGSLRLDKHFDRGAVLSLEYGDSTYKGGGPQLTGAGRRLALNSQRPYARLNFSHRHWSFHTYVDRRKDAEFAILSAGTFAGLDSRRFVAEIQGNTRFAGGRGRIIGGASYAERTSDTGGTASFDEVEADFESVFSQVEYDFSKRLRGVLSLRWDDSNVYDSQVSPRAALVYAASPRHTFRATFGEAFQSPNLSDFFLQINIAPPITAFAGLEEAFCAPHGVRCGLGAISVKALGNPELEVEEVRAFEIGYNGIFADRVFLTVDIYRNELQNFITELIPALNPTLGLLNPAFAPYRAPAELPAAAAAQLEAILLSALPTLTNAPLTRLPILKAATYTNFGEVDTQGLEVGLTARLDDRWSLEAAFNWFDFDIKNQIEQDPLVANSPESQYAAGLTYQGERTSASLKYRYVEGFFWSAGIFTGPVPSYDLLDLAATHRLSEKLEIGLNVSNLLDDEHYQAFGGDLIGRRILGYVDFRW